MQQLEERRRNQQLMRSHEQLEKEVFTKNSKGPDEANRYEREKQKADMIKYREDLDMIRNASNQSNQYT
jgi:hypothetical protein